MKILKLLIFSTVLLFYRTPGITGIIRIPEEYVTIQEGISAATSGDTVLVAPGTYFETITIKNGVSLIGSGARCTEIVDTGREYYTVLAADNSILEDFTIVRQYSEHAVDCPYTSPVIRYNIIVNSGSGNALGIMCNSNEATIAPTIDKNLIVDFVIGIQLMYFVSATITNNIIITNSRSYASTGIRVDCFCDATIRNNTIIIKHDYGISIVDSNPVINNNIIYNTGEGGCGIENEFLASPILSYNNIWNMLINYYDLSPGKCDISADPMFMNIEKGDLRLQPGSPSIDAGDPDSTWNDLDGTRNDQGAFGGPDPISFALAYNSFVAINVSNASGFPEDTISVDVVLDNAAGLAHGRINLTYDPSLLSPVNVTTTNLTSDFDIQVNDSIAGSIFIELDNENEIPSGSGNILIINFKVTSTALPQQSSSLGLENINLFDDLGNEIKIKTITSGVFIVNLGNEEGNYVFVDGNYSGIEEGTPSRPFNTIMEGINYAKACDTVQVAAGEYYEQITLKDSVYVRGTGTQITKAFWNKLFEPTIKSIGVVGSGISKFTLGQTDEYPSTNIIECENSSPIISQNRIEIFHLSYGILCQNESNPLIERNVFYFTHGNGLGIYLDNSSPIIIKNTILERSSDPGISCNNNSNPLIIGNIIKEVSGSSIDISKSNPTIKNNQIYIGDGWSTGITLSQVKSISIFNNIFKTIKNEGIGILCKNSNNVNIINNTILNLYKGIKFETSAAIVMNNIISANSEEGIYCNGGSTIDLSYNDLWNNGTNYFGISPGPGDITEDPQLVDVDNENYQLALGSPCIDAGNPALEYNDLDDTRNDMGAYGGPNADTSDAILKPISLSIASITVSPHDTIVLPISVNHIENLAKMNFTITYDKRIVVLRTIRTTQETSKFSVSTTFMTDGIVNISMNSLASQTIIKQNLLNLLFIVHDISDTMSSTIELSDVSAQDEFSNSLPITSIINGKITIIPTEIKTFQHKDMDLNFQLLQNYPNPFNSKTTICYKINKNGRVCLDVLNILGQKVRTLVDENKSSGNYQINWDGKDSLGQVVTSGIYISKLKMGNSIKVRKILCLK